MNLPFFFFCIPPYSFSLLLWKLKILMKISSSHVQTWELDHKEGWALKNWCFQIVVLEKTLESPLDCKEIQPVSPKGDQPWIFIGRTDAEAEAEAPILWSPDVESWLIGKDPDVGKEWGQKEKGITLDVITDSKDMSLSELQKTVKDREAWCAAVYGVTKSWIRLSDWTVTTNENLKIWRAHLLSPRWFSGANNCSKNVRICTKSYSDFLHLPSIYCFSKLITFATFELSPIFMLSAPIFPVLEVRVSKLKHQEHWMVMVYKFFMSMVTSLWVRSRESWKVQSFWRRFSNAFAFQKLSAGWIKTVLMY